jgi:16S rRNA (cytosine967-C5)-methyltransferase
MNARDLAYAVLKDWKPKGAFAGDRLEALFGKHDVSPQDRRLATELVFGVIRRQATLDVLLAPHVARPRRNVENDLWTLLRLGAYQLAFLSGMADHAAVNETVELAKRANRRWPGFVNAVLRKLVGVLTDDVLSLPTADGVPLADGRFRLLTEKVFPDPEENPAGYFAEAFSFPTWLAKRWSVRFDSDDLFDLGKHFDGSPAITLRVNRLKTTRDAVLEELKAARIKAKAGEHPDAIRLKESARVEDLPGFADGRITVQDETAMYAATLLDPQPGRRVLDLCAAPGTKSSHLAEIMGDTGEIVAADASAERLKRVDENGARLGLKSIRTVAIGDDGSGLPEGLFDAVLLDVPCSNTGVLGKRPEARWRVTPNDLKELPPKQAGLLALALDRVTPGGRIVYSTCSIEPEENEQVVQAALAGRDGVRVIDSRLHLPGDPSDGGFQAVIVKGE